MEPDLSHKAGHDSDGCLTIGGMTPTSFRQSYIQSFRLRRRDCPRR
jgi:hypothetical protein